MEGQHSNHPGELSTERSQAVRLLEPGERNARAEAMRALSAAGVPFLVGGAYAFGAYTGIWRDTKDLDLFPRKEDAPRALDVLAEHGWRTERTDDVWIYKAFRGPWYVDFIFSSGNGVAAVDDTWFQHARRADIMDVPVLVVPPEEMIWSKAFVLERERYDGADVIHLIKSTAHEMDWARLLARFDRYWEVLYSHLLLFRFAYPGERDLVPDSLLRELGRRMEQTVQRGPWPVKLCRGTLLSRFNYALDIGAWGYVDGRRWDEADRTSGGGHATGPELEDPRRGGG